MDSFNKIKYKIAELFSSEDITYIKAKDLLHIPLDEWQYINDNKIRYKIVDKNEKFVTSITEWLEDDIFLAHVHEDADETIFIIKGFLKSLIDRLAKKTYQKLFYKAGTIHKIWGKKGTLISVKFDFIK
jgi:hypothetical protein